jgi:hypothetical protein
MSPYDFVDYNAYDDDSDFENDYGVPPYGPPGGPGRYICPQYQQMLNMMGRDEGPGRGGRDGGGPGWGGGIDPRMMDPRMSGGSRVVGAEEVTALFE